MTNTKRSRKVLVGTTQKSMDVSVSIWLVRKGFQVCEGGRRERGRYLAMVDAATS